MFTTEIFQSEHSSWNKIKDRIIFLEQEAFGDKAFTNEQISEDFLNKNNFVVLLKEKESDMIVGFTYAKPIEEAEPNRAEEKGETAYIWDTVIKKEYRGRGLVGILTSRLEEELIKKNYKYIERYAIVANNYANNILKHYKDRIVKSKPYDSIYGPQVYFRIKL